MALWFLFFLGIGGRSIFSCVDALNIKVRRYHLFSCFSRYHFLKLMLVVYLHSTCGTWHYIMPLHLYRLCCSFLCLLSSQKIASHSSDLFATRMLLQLMFDIWLKKCFVIRLTAMKSLFWLYKLTSCSLVQQFVLGNLSYANEISLSQAFF